MIEKMAVPTLTRIDDVIAQLVAIRAEHGNLPVGAYWHDELGSVSLRFDVEKSAKYQLPELAHEPLVVAPTWITS